MIRTATFIFMGIMAMATLNTRDISKNSPIQSDKPVLLFDFDGTIANTMNLAFESYNRIAANYNSQPADDEDIKKFKAEGISAVFSSPKISKWYLPLIVSAILSEMKKSMGNVQPIDGMIEAILQLKADGYTLGVVTSNSEDNLQQFLKNNRLDHGVFDFHYCKSALSGKSAVFEKLMTKYKLSPSQIIYIGDESRDIDAAHKVGMRIISVSWGFNDKELLEAKNPDALVDTPEELTVTILNMNDTLATPQYA